MVIIKVFRLNINLNLLWSSIVFTTLLMGVIILSMLDFRMLLVLSSIGNNSWLLIGQMVHFIVFLFYILVYSISLFLVLKKFGGLSKLVSVKSLSSIDTNFSFWVLTLSGIPPFPLFYLKILVVFTLFYMIGVNYMLVLFLLSSAFMFISYVRSLINHYVYVYSTSIFYLLKY